MLKYKEQLVVAIVLLCLGVLRIIFNVAEGKWISIVNIIGMCIPLYVNILNIIIENLKKKSQRSYRFFVGCHVILFFLMIVIIACLAFGNWSIKTWIDDLFTLIAIFFSICPQIFKNIIIWVWRLESQ